MRTPSRALAFAGGVALDRLFGDPPTSWHPVGLVGRAAHALREAAPDRPRARRDYGLAMAAVVPEAAGAVAFALSRLHRPTRPLTEAWLLAFATSQRTLLARADEVRAALAAGDLDRARRLLGYHLVSRDTSTLDASEIAGATIESVAENLSDGVVAPWLWFALGGVGGAWAYRAANTLDAMWGYRDGDLADLGFGAAKLDDALNLAPARVTALAIIGAARLEGRDARAAWATWRRDARRTASPNAGHPMAAMAGALGVSLVKREGYALGEGLRAPADEDIRDAIGLARRAADLVAGGLLGGLVAWDLAR